MAKSGKRRRWRWLRRVVLLGAAITCGYLAACLAGLVVLRSLDPPTTGVQAQRRIESWIHRQDYRKQQRFVPLARISINLQHAVIAAEDGRFYQHNGVDWDEIEKMIDEEVPRGRFRGASTLTQQLVKNLFMTTHPNPVRKLVEFLLAPAAEKVLGKRRILELYLNVVEWGPGVFGIEAAAQYHYHTTAAALDREQSARLAAVLPNPHRWQSKWIDRYTRIILTRMSARGW